MKVRRDRLNIAVLGGGVHTIPSYRAFLNRLNLDHDIILYSEFKITAYYNSSYHIQSFTSEKSPKYFLYAWFILRFSFDHLKKPFDVIHSHSTYPSGYVGILLSKVFGIPILVSLNAAEASKVDSIKFGDLINPRRRKLNERVIKAADKVIVLTHFQKDEVVKAFGVKEVEVISRGIDSGYINKSVSPIPKKKHIIFLHVGYLHPVKDPITLIKCFSILIQSIPCKLIQVGKDYMSGQVHQLVKELNLSDHVDFYDFIPNNEIHALFESADVLLHTSLYESLPFVVNEAMAHGLLVCGTRVGLLADLEQQCCIACPPNDPELLASSVLSVLNDKQKCDTLRENGLGWSKEFDLSYTVNKYNKLYRELTTQ